MTPRELAERLSAEEFAEFAEVYRMEDEETEKAREDAKREAESRAAAAKRRR